jgi:hypothetical protein
VTDAELKQLRGRIMHVLGDVEALAAHMNTLMGSHSVPGKPFPIQYLRRQRGWSQARVIVELKKAAAICGQHLPTETDLKSMVAAWERGLPPSPFHRELLGMVFSGKNGTLRRIAGKSA